MFLKISVHHKTNRNSFKIRFLVTDVIKLYYVVTFEMSLKNWFLGVW